MYFPENLIYLRKRDKITQEELADKLGVSRQSVSKWETGEAYPETDKLISLCEAFGISLDDLLRKDMPSAEKEANTVGKSEFFAHMNKFSKSISSGIFLILAGVAVCVALAGYSVTLAPPLSDVTAIMGGVAVLLFVAVAVFAFIFSGISHDRFRKNYSVAENFYGESEIKAFSRKFAIAMATLVSGILLDVIFLIIMCTFIDTELIKVANKEAATSYTVSAFLAALSFLVSGIVYFGIQHTKYNVSEYNSQNAEDFGTSPKTKLKNAICGAVMMTATALFLIMGFVWNLWHPGWIVFPVGGIICGIIGAFFKN